MSSETRAVTRIDGDEVGELREPRTVDELRETLRELSARRQHAVIVGGGTRAAFGNRGGPFDVAISTARLNRVIQYDPDDLTIAVEPGCTIQQLHDTLGARGQQLALDVAHAERATIGGAYACGLSGPRRLGGGALKDWTIGVEVAGPDGELAKAGGMVVKNVTGFDMMHVHYGALGALGVVTRLNLKVFPKPDAERSIALRCDSAAAAYAAASALLRSQLQLSALLVSNADGWQTHVRLDAPAGVIAQLVERVLAVAGQDGASVDAHTTPSGDDALAPFARVVDLTGGRAVARVALPASRQLPALEALESLTSVSACADLGSGLLYLAAPPSTTFLAAAGVRATWLALPPELKAGRDVFGALDERVTPVIRQLKDAFDPARRLNRGRWVLGL